MREALGRRESPPVAIAPLAVYGGSGVVPGVDLTSSVSLAEAMEGGERFDARR